MSVTEAFAAVELARPQDASCRTSGPAVVQEIARELLHNNLAELSGQIVARASGKEQRVRRTVRSCAAAEINGPQLVNVNHLSKRVLHGSDKGAGVWVEGIDGALVGVVRDQ